MRNAAQIGKRLTQDSGQCQATRTSGDDRCHVVGCFSDQAEVITRNHPWMWAPRVVGHSPRCVCYTTAARWAGFRDPGSRQLRYATETRSRCARQRQGTKIPDISRRYPTEGCVTRAMDAGRSWRVTRHLGTGQHVPPRVSTRSPRSTRNNNTPTTPHSVAPNTWYLNPCVPPDYRLTSSFSSPDRHSPIHPPSA